MTRRKKHDCFICGFTFFCKRGYNPQYKNCKCEKIYGKQIFLTCSDECADKLYYNRELFINCEFTLKK